MDKNFLQKKLLEIYHDQVELNEQEKQYKGLLGWEVDFNDKYKQLLDKATNLLEKCIREGVRDDD